jgi:L-asparagine transporter-like permease
MELEKIVIEGDNNRANKAQTYSFIITLAFLIMAVVLFILGKDIPAAVAVITGIVPVIVSFINSAAKRKEEREAKRRNLGMIK